MILILLILLSSSKLWAASDNSEIFGESSLRPAVVNHLDPYEKAEHRGHPAFLSKFSTEKYRASNATGRDRDSLYPSVSIRMGIYQDWKSFLIAGEVEGFVTVTQSKNRYLNIPEFYLGSGTRHKLLQIYGGRKKENWSQLDSFWHLGIWQPRFRWDYFDPEVVGLTGFYLEKQWGPVSFAMFGSPLFVPEQGATFDENNGQITSTHPFFSPPPKTFPIFGEETTLKYTIMVPEIKKILLNPGISTFAKVDLTEHVWAKASYGYLPINQFLMSYEAFLSHVDHDAQVKLYPRVAYHHMIGLDFGHSTGKWDMWMSALGEIPNDSKKPLYMTTQNIRSGLFLSPGTTFRFSGEGVTAHSLSASLLQTMGGTLNDSGLLAAPHQQIMESRYQYRTAAQLQWKLPVHQWGQQYIAIKNKVVEELSVSGTLISSDFILGRKKNWELNLGFDVVGASRSRAPGENGGADFWSLYRANDRIRGSIAYVF